MQYRLVFRWQRSSYNSNGVILTVDMKCSWVRLKRHFTLWNQMLYRTLMFTTTFWKKWRFLMPFNNVVDFYSSVKRDWHGCCHFLHLSKLWRHWCRSEVDCWWRHQAAPLRWKVQDSRRILASPETWEFYWGHMSINDHPNANPKVWL